MALHYRDIVHPEDEKALRQLQNTVGVQMLAEKMVGDQAEGRFFRQHMADYIKVDNNQLPDIYNIFLPIIQKFGIPEPTIFVSGETNAYTMGDKNPIIVIGAPILNFPPDERDAIIAHECGHILCHHCLYKTMYRVLQLMLDPQKLNLFGLSGLAMFTGPVLQASIYASAYWSRRSEYSADRAAALYTSPESLKRALIRLKYGRMADCINYHAFEEQAKYIDNTQEDSTLGKIINSMLVATRSHPFDTVRLSQVTLWGNSAQFRITSEKMNNPEAAIIASHCPNCNRELAPEWKFCNYCGQKL